MPRAVHTAKVAARRSAALLTGVSLATLGLATALAPTSAKAQAFGSMVGMQAGKVTLPNGQMSQWTGANTPVVGTGADGRPLMTIQQTKAKALLDWEQFRLQTDEVLEFQQQSADWLVVNRVHGTQAAQIDGEIRAKGRVFIFNDNGVLLGKDAKINVRQLVTGQGVSDVNVDGQTTIITQSKDKAILNWSDMSLSAGEALRFNQEKKDWIALNRSMAPGVTRLDGSITADGHLYLIGPQGLAINGTVKAQQVVASSLNMTDEQFAVGLNSYARDFNNRMDPTFTNTWEYFWGYSTESLSHITRDHPQVVDPNDPLHYNVTVGRSGSIETGEYGKIMLFGPKVTNQGTLKIRDEGQVVLAAGENIYLKAGVGGMVDTFTGAFNPMAFLRLNLPYTSPSSEITTEDWQRYYFVLTGVLYEIGETVPFDAVMLARSKSEAYLNNLQAERAKTYTARNEGIISGLRGGRVDFRGLNLEQMGAITLTSTALFRGSVNFQTIVRDYREYPNGDMDGPDVPGHGSVIFGKGSLTQITPDLDSTDQIPVGSGPQSVGSIKINAAQVHMQEDAMIYLPSGAMNVLLDAGGNMYDNNRGQGANQDNEDGTRFMMDRGATIDLSGWKTTVLPMGYHQVTGKLFAAQLSDSPLQRDGPLYRQEISVDRRYGTNLANWSSFDNLSQGTLEQFLTNGGTFTMDVGDDFIMKPGSIIDVSGGMTTYEEGYVYTTLLRRLDGTVIDIREADPDELYMGLANEWTRFDTKWNKSQKYYIPLMSSVLGKYETTYVQGGAGGKIEILAPDVVLQGTVLGSTTVGRYQRDNIPKGGSFILNKAGVDEGEYVSNNILITAIESVLSDNFGLYDKLSDTYGDFFGEEFDHETDAPASKGRLFDNSTLTSDDFFNRSTMGSYSIWQGGRVQEFNPFPPQDGAAVVVEKGVDLHLANGASFELNAQQRMQFLGDLKTEGGSISLSGMSLEFDPTTKLDTRGSWYSDYEVLDPVALSPQVRINGGSISIGAGGESTASPPVGDIKLIMPDTMVIDSSGGAWVGRDGKIKLGKGGNISVAVGVTDPAGGLDLAGLNHARAYGLGGNGAFSLMVPSEIYIGDALPWTPSGLPDANTLLLPTSFFSNSGFSAITLEGASVTVGEGVQIHATSASLQLNEGTLLDPKSPAFWAESGTDIYDIAHPGYLPPEMRSSTLRRGMDITFTAPTLVDEGAVLATEVGGKIYIGGDATILGTIDAPAGIIQIETGLNGHITIGEDAQLLARGATLITQRTVSREGRELVGGQVLPGGQIRLSAATLDLQPGALLDVSGTSAQFDITTDIRGSVVLAPTMVASDAGLIDITGEDLKIDAADYRAFAGGAGARGGSLSINWSGSYGPPGGGSGGASPESVFDNLESYFLNGYIVDANFNPIYDFYGTDLSTIAWEYVIGPIAFAPGTVINSREELLAAFSQYAAAAYGPPPTFMIGDNLPPPTTGGSAPLPSIDPGIMTLFSMFGYNLPAPVTTPPATVRLSTQRISQGGFSAFNLAASPGVLFVGDATIGGRKADGSYVFDSININAPRIMGQKGANVRLEAGVVELSVYDAVGGNVEQGPYDGALAGIDVNPFNPDTHLTIEAGSLMQIRGAEFYGFSDTTLVSHGDIRLVGGPVTNTTPGSDLRPTSTVFSVGKIIFKADQLYAVTGAKIDIVSNDTIEVLPQDLGTPINGSPYEAGAELTLKAPRIIQGGVVRSPLGTINLVAIDDGSAGAGSVTLLAGSLTSASADGHTIPFGYVVNGDTWINPFTGLEMTVLPAKAVNITGATVDLQQNAVIDVSGGGNLYGREFVPGIGGTTDWLTGYRDANHQWVSEPGEIFAVLPSFEGDVAPFGLSGGGGLGVGDKVYLSGGSGLKAGYYTLLPAEYALLPGAFRVTARHGGAAQTNMLPGQRVDLADGSSIQSGYRYVADTAYRDQLNSGFLVMPGDTLRMRSQYNEVEANGFFTSEGFLKKALRTNRPLGDVPRIPIDGGSVVLHAGTSLKLDATLKSAAAKGGRGGFADIDASRIAVVGADTDLAQYDGYLILDSDRLNSFGAESLLLGGVRRQGEQNLELVVSGSEVVIDNHGSVLKGPELLFAARDTVRVAEGAAIETSGQISGSSGDLRVVSAYDQVVDIGVDWDPNDDKLINPVLDKGAVLRVSSGEQVDILRNATAVDAMAALRADPAALAAVNADRAAKGLSQITPDGDLLIADNAVIRSSRSIALDATVDTILAPKATLDAKQISAASSRISIGEVPAGTEGLVFAGDSAKALASAIDLTLKSYSTIDIYGGSTLRATDGMRLDAREFRVLNADGATATLAGKSITLANSSDDRSFASASGAANLLIEADNIYIEGADKQITGVSNVTLKAKERLIGRDQGGLYLPGSLTIDAGAMTVDSGDQLLFDAAGAVTMHDNGNRALPKFDTFGATLSLTGATVTNSGLVQLTGGTVNLRARQGDVVLADGSMIDVTSNISQIFGASVGVGAGAVNLTSDLADVEMSRTAVIDVSGTKAGGDAGRISVVTGLGQANLLGQMKGVSYNGAASGSFSLVTSRIDDFGAFNTALDAGGFLQSRRFEVNQGDLNVTGEVRVREFAAVANDGSINVTGIIRTVGDDGGRIQLSAAKNVILAPTGQLLAKANAADGSGGTVLLETTGRDNGRINVSAGSLIDVSGVGEGGRLVHLRAPQIGGDVAIDPVAGSIVGAREVIAEGFRVYEGVSTIDAGVIAQVSADATDFMTNAAAIRARLGSGVTVQPGIELRSTGDMELVTSWDLHSLRFDGAPGVLTLRAAGDLLLNANLSDGFDGTTYTAALIGGPSWTLNLAAGANVTSPDSLAVLPLGQLADGKGSVIVGGTPDTVEYYRVEITTGPLAGTTENRLYIRNSDGTVGAELDRDPTTGQYIDPTTGDLIDKDPATDDYTDTQRYARAALPEFFGNPQGLNPAFDQYGYGEPSQISQYGQSRGVQWDNSTGYIVRTTASGINVASGRDIVLQYKPSVIYTAGSSAPEVDGFYAPTRMPLNASAGIWGPFSGYYLQGGGDILMRAQGDILGAGSDQLPNAWLWRFGNIDPLGNPRHDGMGGKDLGRPYDQTTWFVRFDRYQAGVGALGGGDIDISAGGDILNLTVNIPNTGRVAGGIDGAPRVLHTAGGGDLSIFAGGDIGTGNFYVADGTAKIRAGGAFISSRDITAMRQIGYGAPTANDYALYTVLFTSSGDLELQSGGDLNIDAVMDPLGLAPVMNNQLGAGGTFGPDGYQQYQGDDRDRELFGVSFFSYTPEASIKLFSAGGDVDIWNNYGNIGIMNWRGGFMQPQHYFQTPYGLSIGNEALNPAVWPGTVSAVAAAGDVSVKGGMILAPAPKGNLELLAFNNVYLGQGTQINDPFLDLRRDADNFFPGYSGIYMSQTRLDLMPSPTNTNVRYGEPAPQAILETAGYVPGGTSGAAQAFTATYAPDLHVGDTSPVLIYAATGDIVTTAKITLPKALEVQAGHHIYFPNYSLQHNNANDLSLVRAGDGLYFAPTGGIAVAGPGRLEIETGRDFYIPSNANGVTSGRVLVYADGLSPFMAPPPPAPWKPGDKAADIAVSTGFNQTPSYGAFEDGYLNPDAVDMADYLTIDTGDGRKLPLYLFDRVYTRGVEPESLPMTPELREGFVNYVRGLQGLSPLDTEAERTDYVAAAWAYWTALPNDKQTPYDAFLPRGEAAKALRAENYLPESREGLVNYVRRMQGLDPLDTQEEQVAYLDKAWTDWQAMPTDLKTPLYRDILFMELRTTGREANAVDNPRFGSSFRGYDAIAALFPGAEKANGEALAEGDSRWAGDFETYASRVISTGGGKIEFVSPGGGFKLASTTASPAETGQPGYQGDRGNALRSGVVTTDGGAINIFARQSVTLNESRVMTTKGGNILIWSSYGDIAAGKGAKTSITPPFYDYNMSNWSDMKRVQAGLPTGAGIQTVASVAGSPVADVDLVAPNGVVDAGDAGISVSGNFNVFAIEILGTDNIDVAGISTGLPVPPAAPPISLDNLAAKASDVQKTINEAIAGVRKTAGIVPPSIIEVKVTGYGDDDCAANAGCATDPASRPLAQAAPAAPQGAETSAVSYVSASFPFNLPRQLVSEAVTAISRQTGTDIIYDAGSIRDQYANAVRGSMSTEKALQQLLQGLGVRVVRTGPATILLRPTQTAARG